MDDKNLCLMLEQYVKQLLYEYIFSVILSLKYYIQSKGVCITMDIYVDADACPVVRIVETVAQKHGIPVTLLCTYFDPRKESRSWAFTARLWTTRKQSSKQQP